jgi:hypothetical protein
MNKQVAIPDVRISLSSHPDKHYRSDQYGNFTIPMCNEQNDTLLLKHSGYQTYEKAIPIHQLKKSSNGTLSLTFYLDHVTLDPFVISYQKIDTVFGSKMVSIEDYLLYENGSKLLLVYEKTLQRGAQLWYVDEVNIVKEVYYLDNIPIQFYKDFAHLNYLICSQSIYEITLRDDRINLATIESEYFYGYRQRILDTLLGHYYYSDYTSKYPAVKFISTRIEDTTHLILREVKDDFMMELYRAQFKYVSGRDKLWAYRKEQETGIDKEIWIGAAVFTQDILYRPVYAPFFIKNDTLLIFDQYKSYLFRHDQSHALIDSVYVNYYKNPKGEKWEQPLMRDEITGEIYSLYNKGGYYYLRQLNTQTGLLTTVTRISHQFVHHLKVHNGFVYYVYRPFESAQRKFLYREKINTTLSLSH